MDYSWKDKILHAREARLEINYFSSVTICKTTSRVLLDFTKYDIQKTNFLNGYSMRKNLRIIVFNIVLIFFSAQI